MRHGDAAAEAVESGGVDRVDVGPVRFLVFALPVDVSS
jgi:hypothetical protein